LKRNYQLKPTVMILSALIALSACGHPTEKAAPPFKPTASVQEIMQSIIDPNADDVWNSVSTVVTSSGTEERTPKSDEEWQAVRKHAITLAEAANLLLIEGRPVAHAGASTSSVDAELSAEQIQKLIDKNRDKFNTFAVALHAATSDAISAIDSKNTEELVRVGGKIDQVCESCHSTFWYPNDKRPSFPPLTKP
jgi:cytochrome c556